MQVESGLLAPANPSVPSTEPVSRMHPVASRSRIRAAGGCFRKERLAMFAQSLKKKITLRRLAIAVGAWIASYAFWRVSPEWANIALKLGFVGLGIKGCCWGAQTASDELETLVGRQVGIAYTQDRSSFHYRMFVICTPIEGVRVFWRDRITHIEENTKMVRALVQGAAEQKYVLASSEVVRDELEERRHFGDSYRAGLHFGLEDKANNNARAKVAHLRSRYADFHPPLKSVDTERIQRIAQNIRAPLQRAQELSIPLVVNIESLSEKPLSIQILDTLAQDFRSKLSGGIAEYVKSLTCSRTRVDPRALQDNFHSRLVIEPEPYYRSDDPRNYDGWPF